jgi:DNA polymerase III alpha subunit
MKFDQFGQCYTSSNLLADNLYQNPDLDLAGILVTDPTQYNNSIDTLHCDFVKLQQYIQPDISVEQFDHNNQRNWYMPQEYVDLDIAKHVLGLCSTSTELQRVGQELLLYQERNLFPLLCYLKYLVDTLRKNQIIWGVGRGSSTASYVLYLLGVHKINSIYYDLPIEEFLKG